MSPRAGDAGHGARGDGGDRGKDRELYGGLIRLHILHHASGYLAEALGDSRFAAPPIIEKNMREGRIGMKPGQGFMNYDGVDLAAYREKRLAAFASALRAMGLAREPVA